MQKKASSNKEEFKNDNGLYYDNSFRALNLWNNTLQITTVLEV